MLSSTALVIFSAVILISISVNVFLVYLRDGILEDVLSSPDCAQLVTSVRLKIPPASLEWWIAQNIFSSHVGKEFIRPVFFENIPAVLKLKRLPENFPIIAEVIDGTTTTPFEHVKQSLLANYHEGVTEELLQKIQSEDLDSVFRRLQQVEYFFLLWSSIPQNTSPYFPRLLAICGDVYTVEQVEEVLDEKFVLNKSWEEMQPVINSFLSLTEYLDHASIELCDVKLDNFGWDTSSEQVKLIDLDTAFFTGSLLEQFRERDCASDDDCGLFSCRGRCDVPKWRCVVEVQDTNLERICRNMFATRFIEMGLFSGVPLAKKAGLLELVEKCGKSKMNTSEFRSLYEEMK